LLGCLLGCSVAWFFTWGEGRVADREREIQWGSARPRLPRLVLELDPRALGPGLKLAASMKLGGPRSGRGLHDGTQANLGRGVGVCAQGPVRPSTARLAGRCMRDRWGEPGTWDRDFGLGLGTGTDCDGLGRGRPGWTIHCWRSRRQPDRRLVITGNLIRFARGQGSRRERAIGAFIALACRAPLITDVMVVHPTPNSQTMPPSKLSTSTPTTTNNHHQ